MLELAVPVDGIAEPGLPRLGHPGCESDCPRDMRQTLRPRRRRENRRAGRAGRTARLSLIAGYAGHDDVLPVGPPPLHARDHVLVGELVTRNAATAVLTATAVANGHVG